VEKCERTRRIRPSMYDDGRIRLSISCHLSFLETTRDTFRVSQESSMTKARRLSLSLSITKHISFSDNLGLTKAREI